MNDLGTCREGRELTPEPEYSVGYKKPPKHTQFKKGQSGNKSGRPKGKTKKRHRALSYALPAETLKQTFLEEAYRMVNINTGQGEESIPISQAIIRALGVKAAKGHISAQRLFATTLFELEASERKLAEDRMGFLIDYKKDWTAELKSRAERGMPLDLPVPHPDDIVFDMDTGTLEVRGPLCEEEKAKFDHYRSLLNDWEEQTAKYRNSLENPEPPYSEASEIDTHIRTFAKEEVKRGEKIISMLKTIIGDKEPEGLWEREKMRRKG